MQFFFDLDGTLINSQPRLFRLFCDMCPENRFTYDEYCAIKRRKVTQAQFLKTYFQYDEQQISDFHRHWLEAVESPERMLEDTEFPGASALLKQLSLKHDIYIITHRQSRIETQKQIERMGWSDDLSELIVSERKMNKESLAFSRLRDSRQSLWVGDTGEDIKAAKALGTPAVAVSWGVIAPDLLQEYQPDDLVYTMDELASCIRKYLRTCAGSNICNPVKKECLDDI